MSRRYNVAVVGATGAVGLEMIRVLGEREFPVGKLLPLASERSLGKTVEFNGQEMSVDVLGPSSFDGVEIALFSAGGDVSRKYVPVAAESGAVAIDNTSAFRMDADVPLVVPEVNAGAIEGYKKRNIIANPNCSTIQLVVVLNALRELSGIKRVVVDTYQSVSGAGLSAMEELSKQTVALFSGGEIKVELFPHRIAFNCIPHIGKFKDDGSTEEELKLIEETKKIMGDDSMRVASTAVRVPVFYGHSEAVHVEFEDDVSPDAAREALEEAPSVEVVDETNLCRYPLAIDACGKDAVYVGRLRKDRSVEHGLSMWIVADNIRKGAATNAVQIAEILAEKYLK